MSKYFEHLFYVMKYVYTNLRGWVFLNIIFSVVLGFSPVVTVWLTKELVNNVASVFYSNQTSFSLLLLLLFGLFMSMVVTSLIQNIKSYFNNKSQLYVEQELQSNILEKIGSLEILNYENPQFHNHIQRLRFNTGSNFLNPVNSIFSIFKSFITLTSFVVYLLTIHWGLFVLSVAIIIPSLFVQMKFNNQNFSLNFFQSQNEKEKNYYKRLMYEKESSPEIKSYSLGSHFKEKWLKLSKKTIREKLLLSKKQTRGNVYLDGLSSLFYGISALFIVWLIKKSRLGIGDFVAVGQAVEGTQEEVANIATNVASIYGDLLYIEDYRNFIDYQDPFHKTEKHRQPIGLSNDHLVLQNVSFRYPNAPRDSIHNITLNIKRGEKIAIVGENGSGKTTLIKSMTGLYKSFDGEVFIDGFPLNHYKGKALYDKFAICFQHYIKYPLSAGENITLGNVDNSDDERKRQDAAHLAGSDSYISKMADGYSTVLGKTLFDGADLSGGQWQRMAIARTLFKDSDILVFDEPTSSLDPLSESEIYKKIKKGFGADKTIIYITHRMLAAKEADRIIVLKDGEIAEVGNHYELIEKGTVYQKMFQKQVDLQYTVN